MEGAHVQARPEDMLYDHVHTSYDHVHTTNAG